MERPTKVERPASWMRDHLANERTLLAWVRTALALNAFGLGVAKLGTLVQVAVLDHPELAATLPDPRWSEGIGMLLVATGFAAALAGLQRARVWAREVPGDQPSGGALWAMAVVSMLTSAGLAAYIALGVAR